jgi:hypothetical protein
MDSDSPHPLFRFRFLFLAGYFALWALVILALCFDNSPLHLDFDSGSLIIAFGIILVLQILFLVGAPHVRAHRSRGGRPMVISIIVGSIVAGALSVAVFATLLSLAHIDADDLKSHGLENILTYALLIAWIPWFCIFAFVLVGEWIQRYRKMYRLLLGGTLLELVVTIPVDIAVRRRTKCYCGEGTFVAMIIGISSLFWVLGPGIVLLFLARCIQRRKNFGYCRHCGYDLRMLPTQRCPECGTAFEPTARSRVPES